VNARPEIDPQKVEELRDRLSREAEASGYHLNPDAARTGRIVRGLLSNEARHGYRSCPCRLAVSDRAKDADIVCPCDYRDADLGEWGACFCGLYVSGAVLRGERKLEPVPERRPARRASAGQPSSSPVPSARAAPAEVPAAGLSHPVWRCRVCGYLCARERPPEACPVCKAGSDRFERFL